MLTTKYKDLNHHTLTILDQNAWFVSDFEVLRPQKHDLLSVSSTSYALRGPGGGVVTPGDTTSLEPHKIDDMINCTCPKAYLASLG